MSRILIIEDEEAIADLEKDYLELSGFEVEICNRGDTGLTRALNEEFDLIILDLMLPEVDGFDICRQVRQEKNTPIIMVSAKKDDIDKIRGLGLGADDYMTKPFSPSELVARVKAHMDRYNRLIGSNVRKNDIVEIRGIKIDKTARRVWVNGEETTFTSKEYDLLTFLAENPNRVFTKEELFRDMKWETVKEMRPSLKSDILRSFTPQRAIDYLLADLERKPNDESNLLQQINLYLEKNHIAISPLPSGSNEICAVHKLMRKTAVNVVGHYAAAMIVSLHIQELQRRNCEEE